MRISEIAKELLSSHGEVQSQTSNEWKGPFQLPLAAERFYKEVGPVDVTIESIGNPYFLPRLSGLWDYQKGYRWNGLNGEPVEDWNDDWIVVADEGGDPFILSRSSEAILHAYHGEGEWAAEEIFSDLNTMAACLASLGALVREAGSMLTGEDYSIRPEFRASALNRLAQLIGSTRTADDVLGFLGWG